MGELGVYSDPGESSLIFRWMADDNTPLTLGNVDKSRGFLTNNVTAMVVGEVNPRDVRKQYLDLLAQIVGGTVDNPEAK